MKDKVVLITGANGGLGKNITNSFLKADAKVVGAALSIKNDEFDHKNFVARETDLTDRKSIENLIQSTIGDFGKIDVLIHTIGGFAGGKSIVETDDETFEKMLTLNLRTAFYLFRAVIPEMRKSGNGRIVAVGSRSAVESSPFSAAYGASKAALVSLVQSVAVENKDTEITINAILPATIDTPQNRANSPDADFTHWVSAENIADTVLWLSSKAAGDINGALIPIYGKGV